MDMSSALCIRPMRADLMDSVQFGGLRQRKGFVGSLMLKQGWPWLGELNEQVR